MTDYAAIIPLLIVALAGAAAMLAEAFRQPGERMPIAGLGLIGLTGAAVASVFADHDVSIETVRQRVLGEGDSSRAELVVVTHRAPDSALSATVAALTGLDTVDEVVSWMRVEGA